MLISDFDYHLPKDQIAQLPPAERQLSRMLVVGRAAAAIEDLNFTDLPNQLRPGDVLILNNTRVFPARIFGVMENGARIEIFLAQQTAEKEWEALARPAKRLRPEKVIVFSERLSGRTIGRKPGGEVIIRFDAAGDLDRMIDEIGQVPLPPYIERGDAPAADDRERYQTVFAKNRGAIAAPTAGLHFTPEILDSIRGNGVLVEEITLHVGYGTFEPIRSADLAGHAVRPETYEIGEEAADRLNQARREGRRFVAVGTTTVRALEASISTFGKFVPGRHVAELTITPGYVFSATGAMLTNFHLPRSSLLVLTSTFAGHDLIMRSYRHAVAAGYRFYSYGDCMLIV
jgi:S-adenosylmethionine:tRNA ribosyltransferase-isomerase